MSTVGYLANPSTLGRQINALAETYVKPAEAASGDEIEDDDTRAKRWARDNLSRKVSIATGV